MMRSTLIVGVNYRSATAAERFVRSLADQNVDLVLVDNSVDEEELRRIRSAVGGAGTVVASEENRGYLGGALHGIALTWAAASVRHDWVCVCNVDLELVTGSISQSLANLSASVGVAGPVLRASSRGPNLNPLLENRPRIEELERQLDRAQSYSLFAARGAAHGLKQRLWTRNSGAISTLRPVYAVHGSFVAVRREVVDVLMRRSDIPFLYFEEHLIAEAARAVGLDTVCLSGPEFRHHAGVSTGFLKSRWTWNIFRESNQLMLDVFEGRSSPSIESDGAGGQD